MISCKKATQYILKREQGRLSIKKRLELWLHLGICSLCKLFFKQNAIINKSLQKSGDSPVPGLSELDKAKIASLMEASI